MLLEKFKTFAKKFFYTKKPFCYAPFGSLYFNQNGNVTACCQNRMYLLGKYPEDSVQKIWQSDKIKLLRDCMHNHDLSRGCFGCDPQGINNFKLNREYDFLNGDSKFPKYIFFQLSNICNLNCIMCNHENSINQVTVNPSIKVKNIYDDNFVDQIEKYIPYLERASFLGGETFLIDIFYDLWERIIKINNKITIAVLSNGTIYNDRIETLLTRGNFEISLSIDSFSKENYEKIRKNADFNKTMENVGIFNDYMKNRGQKLIIDLCLMKENLEEIPSIFEHCCLNNFNVFVNNVIWPQVHSLKFLNSEDLIIAQEHLKRNQNNVNWKNNNENKQVYRQIINQIDEWEKEALDYERSDLYLTNDIEKLKEILIPKIKIFIAREMGYLDKNEIISIQNNLHNYIEILKSYVKSDDELIAILKNIQQIPLNEIITEFLVSEKNTVIDRLLMFR